MSSGCAAGSSAPGPPYVWCLAVKAAFLCAGMVLEGNVEPPRAGARRRRDDDNPAGVVHHADLHRIMYDRDPGQPVMPLGLVGRAQLDEAALDSILARMADATRLTYSSQWR